MSGTRMTEALVSQICKDKGYYRSPELNTRLYLHFLGFEKIENLEKFKNCRALWLENNSIEVIENLAELTSLTTLFLQNNQIRSFLQETLEPVCKLAQEKHLPSPRAYPSRTLISVSHLNISSNLLSSLKGITFIFPNLEILVAKNNLIKSVDGELGFLSNLTVLDLGNNQIDDPVTNSGLGDTALDDLVNLTKTLHMLGTLIMNGNPFVRKAQGYRKKLISSCKTLKFIDESPVFEEERIGAEAFERGGRTAEREANEKFKSKREEQHLHNMRRFDELINSQDNDHMDDVFISQRSDGL